MREETFALGWTAANKRPLAACTVFRAFGAVRHDPDQLPAGRPRRVHSRQLLFDSVTISVSRPRFRGRRSELNHSADTKAGTWMNPRRPGFRMLPHLPLHPPLIPTGDLAKNDLEMIMLARFLRAQEAATLLRLLSGPICPSASALQPCVLGSPCPGLRIDRAQGKFVIPLFRLPRCCVCCVGECVVPLFRLPRCCVCCAGECVVPLFRLPRCCVCWVG